MTLARMQQALTLGAILLAGLVVSYGATTGRPGLAVGGLVLLAGGHAAVLAVEFLLMHQVNRHAAAPRASAGQLLAAWWGESRHAPLVFCWRQPFRSHVWADTTPAGTGRRGVLLVHGFVCNRGLWNRWLARLHQRGVPVVAVDLEPVFGSIDDYVATLEAALRRLERATGLPPLVVAHSMGGLAVRRWLSTVPPQRVHHVITIGTPHHGTWLARWALTPNSRQMRRASRWLGELQGQEPVAHAKLFTCFYSHCDNIVFPAQTATLPGADNRHLEATAHVQMVDHPQPWEEALRRLA